MPEGQQGSCSAQKHPSLKYPSLKCCWVRPGSWGAAGELFRPETSFLETSFFEMLLSQTRLLRGSRGLIQPRNILLWNILLWNVAESDQAPEGQQGSGSPQKHPSMKHPSIKCCWVRPGSWGAAGEWVSPETQLSGVAPSATSQNVGRYFRDQTIVLYNNQGNNFPTPYNSVKGVITTLLSPFPFITQNATCSTWALFKSKMNCK